MIAWGAVKVPTGLECQMQALQGVPLGLVLSLLAAYPALINFAHQLL